MTDADIKKIGDLIDAKLKPVKDELAAVKATLGPRYQGGTVMKALYAMRVDEEGNAVRDSKGNAIYDEEIHVVVGEVRALRDGTPAPPRTAPIPDAKEDER